MKSQNEFLEKYGVDKVLHFLVGSLIVAMASSIGHVFLGFTGFLAASFLMIPVVYAVSYYKEKRMDDHFDALDIKAAMLGAGIVVILNVLMFAIYAITHDM